MAAEPVGASQSAQIVCAYRRPERTGSRVFSDECNHGGFGVTNAGKFAGFCSPGSVVDPWA